MSRQKRRKKQKQEKRDLEKKQVKARVPYAPKPYASPVPLEPFPFPGDDPERDCVRWRIPQRGAMNVPGVVFADSTLLPDVLADKSLEQVANVATLPGIVGASFAMPDIHMGYGFPIGGVAAFDATQGGVVSPGGVGYDINCGVRFLASDMHLDRIGKRIEKLTDTLFEAIPAGVGSRRKEISLSGGELSELLMDGMKWAKRKGLANNQDEAHTEDRGKMAADLKYVSNRAKQRGGPQLGTLGSGNHFAEIGVVDEVFDEEIAEAFGLELGQITLMIHSGSRGLGHQVCTDFLKDMFKAVEKYDIPLADKQLCCAPIHSDEGERYLSAMAAAANFAFMNRLVMAHWARQVFDDMFGAELRTVYDVCHNIAKREQHVVDGVSKELVVHRKGATRALPPQHPDLPERYQKFGQPVVIPGDMGRYSFVMAGAAHSSETMHSACHGAGRLLSRSEAKRRFTGRQSEVLSKHGVFVRGASKATVVEEMPEAYKDVADVVGVVERGFMANPVVRLRPLGVVKG